MSLYRASSSRRRRFPSGALVLSLAVAAAAAPPAAPAATLELSFAVAGGMLVEACGGLVNSCREGALEGTLDLHLDPANGTATLPAGELRFAEPGQASFPLEIPLADLQGTLEGATIRFFTATDSLRYVDWTMTLTAEGLVLQGVFDEGCCDRFVYAFRNVSFAELAPGGVPPTVLLLNDQRFAVEAHWTDFAGRQGPGRAVGLSADSGTFWFFNAENTELVVKVLDACDPFGSIWFFAAGLTDVGVDLVVTDLTTGVERRYASPVGAAFQPVLDTAAFDTCEAPLAP